MPSYSITRYRKLLLELGFRERATGDLIRLAQDFSTPKRRALAARELAVLLLAAGGAADLQTALDYFELALTGDVDLAYQRAAAILKAEAHLNLGAVQQAQSILNGHLAGDVYLDLYLGLANCTELLDQKLTLVNTYLRAKGLADVSLLEDAQAASTYDCLTAKAEDAAARIKTTEQPLITVIMPSYNSADFIVTAIRSLLAQTWRNIEVLVVDDCSTDTTAHVVSEWAERDPRVRLIKAAENGGPYVARNLALREAAGRFVTCNDADDWSHPQKLALQAQHLLEAPDSIANDSQQTRVTEDLQFYRRGNAGWYTFRNMSSFMFRRDEIAREIGYWDCVRFGADAEFIKRINIVFGQGTVESLETGPVSFQRQSAGSLTAHSAFGYHGFHMGARLEYARQQALFHQSAPTLKYEFFQPKRAFPVPEPMWPTRDRETGARRWYDVVIVADLRVIDDTSWAIAAEVKANAAAGLRTGLVQLSRYHVEVDAPMPDHLRRLLAHEATDILVHGEKIDCGLVVIRCASVLQDAQVYFPDIDAEAVVVVADTADIFGAGIGQAQPDAFGFANTRATELLSKPPLWCAEHPALRDTLSANRDPNGDALLVAVPCWEPILTGQDWHCTQKRPAKKRRTVGYHAQPGLIGARETGHRLTSVYAATDRIERQVLGSVALNDSARETVPQGWHLVEQVGVTVAQFLQTLDIFLCFDPSIPPTRLRHLAQEAMAAGVPVVLDPVQRPNFNDAAIYAEPKGALARAFQLLDDPEAYEQQRARGLDFVRNALSVAAYFERLEALKQAQSGARGAPNKSFIQGLAQRLVR